MRCVHTTILVHIVLKDRKYILKHSMLNQDFKENLTQLILHQTLVANQSERTLP